MLINTNTFSNILLAEDDNTDFEFFIEAFEKIAPGVVAERAKNGLECINLVKQNVYDAVFLDLNMPVKNGMECLKFIKDEVQFKDKPVIIYSTSHYIKDIDAAYKNGAHYYIVKPANADDLPGVLYDVFNRLMLDLNQPGKADFVVGLKRSSETF